MDEKFSQFARRVALITGSHYAALLSILLIFFWLIAGPFFHFSTSWQLLINTGTTVITFLMVFLIQNAQNCDTQAIHLKLDEIIVSHKDTHNEFVHIEQKSREEVNQLRHELEHQLEGTTYDHTNNIHDRV